MSKKQIVRLTESDIRRIVKESVKRVLRESIRPRRFGLRESDEIRNTDNYKIADKTLDDFVYERGGEPMDEWELGLDFIKTSRSVECFYLRLG